MSFAFSVVVSFGTSTEPRVVPACNQRVKQHVVLLFVFPGSLRLVGVRPIGLRPFFHVHGDGPCYTSAKDGLRAACVAWSGKGRNFLMGVLVTVGLDL